MELNLFLIVKKKQVIYMIYCPTTTPDSPDSESVKFIS